MKNTFLGKEKQRFSIRKCSFGAASVFLGATLILGGQVSADQQTTADVETTPTTIQTTAASVADTTATVETNSQVTTEVTTSEVVSSQALIPATDVSETQMVTSEAVTSTITSTVVTSTQTAEVSTAISEVSASSAASQVASETNDVEAVETETVNVSEPTSDISEVTTETVTESKVTVAPKAIPSSGNYTYTERTAVKNEATASAPVVFYADAGDKVSYDKTLTADGYQWISYTSYGGTRRYTAITKLEQSAPTGKITFENQTSQGFDVVVTNVSDDNGIAAVKVPVWTTNADQDDIIWYDAAKQSNGDYKVVVKISDHKNELGNYNVHLYYVENSGKTVGIAATQTTVSKATETTSQSTLPAQGQYTFTQEVEVKNEPKLSANTEFTFEKGEQINYDKVLDADNYQWISYVSYSGTRRYIPVPEIKATTPQDSRTGDISFTDKTNGDFDVVISNVSDSKGVAQVKVPVWTTNADQDDIIWYDAVKQSDGTYKAAVKLSDHKNERGDYNVHLYYVESNGQIAGVTATKHTIAQVKDTRTGDVSFTDKTNGDFDVVISNVSDSKGVAQVKVPVWTTNADQDDIIWYDAVKQSDGTYKTTVKLSDHKNERGDYNVHLYYVESQGQLAGVAATKHTVASEAKSADVTKTSSTKLATQGTYTFTQKVDVKNEPKVAAETEFTFDKGETINYDKVLENDGYQWISYTSYSGTRRYIPVIATAQATIIDKTQETATTSTTSNTLPSQGFYTFTKHVSVMAEPKASSTELFGFNAGDKVNYDKVLDADGHQWLSYLSFSGVRRYVMLG